MNPESINKELALASPKEIVQWALSVAKQPVITTNFRPYEAAILHAVNAQNSDIPVIWCDSGYNTSYTYQHAEKTIQQLGLNIDLYVPKQTAAHRDVIMGIPEPDTPEHDQFTNQVKLEPFMRAMSNHQPDVWFTNLRKGQTALRDSMDIVNVGKDGIIKVCPFYHWSDTELDGYLAAHQLESEDRYYDPTKALANRECGLHTSN
ncbi:phosphoadenosine phosphosulfate reductase family protein [Crocinitomicaceae bacterium]|nr:phosphoadenosine phosphosulfate reductase family protein [Crocinitomicaceae bacterium]MDB3907367.1 phosphoadenosine phosphosulfate reductase family protein [Crocinitomicaceae bacterium]